MRWDQWIKAASKSWRFWQVGQRFDSAVEGCEFYLWGAKNSRTQRKFLALLSSAQAFVGSDPQLIEHAKRLGLKVIELRRAPAKSKSERSELLPPEENL